jgi:hypothetical protein
MDKCMAAYKANQAHAKYSRQLQKVALHTPALFDLRECNFPPLPTAPAIRSLKSKGIQRLNPIIEPTRRHCP